MLPSVFNEDVVEKAKDKYCSFRKIEGSVNNDSNQGDLVVLEEDIREINLNRDPEMNYDSLSTQSMDKLRNIAKNMGLTTSRVSKSKLIDSILAAKQ